MRSSRWLIFAPVAILALFAPSANAEPIAGLQTTYYTITEIPPTRSDNIYTECGSEVENNINRSYDGEPFGECTYDLFMVHMTGFIEIPEHNTIEFWLASDDGGTISIGGNEWGNWWDQGCSWMESGQIDISAGSQPLDLWMYENGGYTCVMLAWNINNQGWSMVPDEAFTTIYSPATTTTIEETTTTWEDTTTSTTTTTTTTTSTIAPSTTVPVEQESTTTTTTTTLPPDTTVPEPTTTTVVEASTTTVEASTTTVLEPSTTVLETTTVPEVETTDPIVTIPPETLPPDTTVSDTTVPDTLPQDVVDEMTAELVEALLDAIDSGEPLTEEQFDSVVEALADLTEEQAIELIDQILATEITANQAEELATNPEVLEVITFEQAEEIFATIDVTELDNTQLDKLVDAVQDAPTQVREAFEEQINVFDDGLGDYVPLGSTVPVDTRRTLIAVAAGAATVAAGQRRVK